MISLKHQHAKTQTLLTSMRDHEPNWPEDEQLLKAVLELYETIHLVNGTAIYMTIPFSVVMDHIRASGES